MNNILFQFQNLFELCDQNIPAVLNSVIPKETPHITSNRHVFLRTQSDILFLLMKYEIHDVLIRYFYGLQETQCISLLTSCIL
jgi:hypothetical protein